MENKCYSLSRVLSMPEKKFDEVFAKKYKEEVKHVLTSIKTNFVESLEGELNEIEKKIESYPAKYKIPIKSDEPDLITKIGTRNKK